MKKFFLLLLLVCVGLCSFTFWVNDLPSETSVLFTGSGNCTLCHSGSEGVLINAAGRDVSPVYHWQSSMMGNAAKDPYWQAKVSSEVEENPHLQTIIEDKCATCHAPMGRTEAIHQGSTHYTFEALKQDALSLDGVSCAVCHQIDPDNLGSTNSFSGNYAIKAVKKMYGPYEDPFTRSMINNTGYTPEYGKHIETSAMCATCHTLITPYVNQDGDVAGYFPEQMPYYEWLNSAYPEQEKSCQKCHMPSVNEEMTISSMPPSLTNKRKPVFEHHFVGGNTIINQMMQDNYTELGIKSGAANLDSTANYTLKNIQNNSIELSTSATQIEQQGLVTVLIKNKTGHKIPTGFPSRRMWIHFYAMNENGDTIFESGNYNELGQIVRGTTFEPHHDTITSEKQVQIYEAVLGNTQNEETTVLLEASQYLKDNRLPPLGFSSGQPYDSLIAITGKAVQDMNFNKSNTFVEGSGTDLISYKFPLSGTKISYRVEICYQSIKPDYAKHIAESSTEESKRFTRMFNKVELPKTEIISKVENSFLIAKTEDREIKPWKIYPNPSSTSKTIHIDGIEHWPISYSIYALNGTLVKSNTANQPLISIADLANGTYNIFIKSGDKQHSFPLIHTAN